MVPFVVLKKMILSKTLNRRSEDRTIQESIEFIQERLNTLTQAELASRLTLNCVNNYIEPEKLTDLTITIIDVSIVAAIVTN
jgi:maspardin